ncbi:MAG: blue (type 1) copper domain protein [Chloroflexota bacterium]|jgi:plastocyanin|nr:blue (type 1) copper domain protein [Chloroflexota bacterium]
MPTKRLLAVSLTVLAVAACTSSTPGWTYAPAPSATPVPSADPSASAAPSASVAPSVAPSAPASAAPGGSPGPDASAAGAVLDVSALNIAFDPTELSAPADQAFQIAFANNEALPHNIEIKDAGGASIFQGEVFTGVATRTYDVPPLAAGSYQFVCTVHPNMVGTLTAQ